MLGPHQVRHMLVSSLLDAGYSVHEVAERLGHDPATLMRSYTRVTRCVVGSPPMTPRRWSPAGCCSPGDRTVGAVGPTAAEASHPPPQLSGRMNRTAGLKEWSGRSTLSVRHQRVLGQLDWVNTVVVGRPDPWGNAR
nr:hypothetical protein [Catellatospora sichuanensis]